MAQLFRYKRVRGIGDDAVKAKTGKKWEEWFALLDKAGARMMDHRDIAGHLQRKFGLAPWWTRLVTSGYQQDRGVRGTGRRRGTYSVEHSKTVAAPLAAVWTAWADQTFRERWLRGAEFEVRRTTPNRAVNLNWPGGTSVTITFSGKNAKTQVLVRHTRLAEGADAERLHAYWSEALARLKETVEG